MSGGRSSRRIRLLGVLLVLLALPGILLLVRDLLRPSPRSVVERAERWHPHVAEASARFGVAPELIVAVIAVESGGDRAARSDRGALGLMQLMPATAREAAGRLGMDPPGEEEILDPRTNVLLGTWYLGRQIRAFGGEVELALAAYHAGPGRVRRWREAHPGLLPGEILDRAAFPVTRSYVSTVLSYRALIAARSPERNRPR